MTALKKRHLVYEISKNFNISLDLAWKFYFLEEMIRLITVSNFNENIIFKGDIIISKILKQHSYSTELELTFQNISLNKFNINRIFRDILRNTNWSIKSIDEIDSIGLNKTYKLNILTDQDKKEEFISIIIDSTNKFYPNTILNNFNGFYLKNTPIKTYSLEDVIAYLFGDIFTRKYKRSKSLYRLYNIYTKIIPDEKQITKSIINYFKANKLILDIDEINLTLDVLKHSIVAKKRWQNDKSFISYEDVMLVLECIVYNIKKVSENKVI